MSQEAAVNFRPLHDQVLVRRKEAAKKYGSIIIPDSAQEQMMEGTVVKSGPGITNHRNGSFIESPVKAGDRVLFGSKYVGSDIKIGEEDLTIMRIDDIAAVIDP